MEALELVTRAELLLLLGWGLGLDIWTRCGHLTLVEPPKKPKREEWVGGAAGRGRRVGLIAKVVERRTCRDSARP